MNQGTILGGQIGRWIVLAALVAVLGALLFLLPGGLVQAQDSTTIEYTENSTDVVLTLSAGDPEGATPITWSLPAGDPDGTGDEGGPLTEADAQDNGDFKISQDGVLEFSSPPDYDDPMGGGTTGTLTNTYNVVVQATDGDAGNNVVAGGIATGVNMVDDDDTRSWFKVIVNVGDINEPGSIKLHPTGYAGATLLQPQIGVQITSHMLMDEDGDSAAVTGATYQWQRSSSMNGPWENITLPATNTDPATYRPRQLDGGARDLGKYLRVVASYTEAGAGGRGGQRAIATSMYPTIKIVGDNNAPSFTEGDDTPDGGATTRAVRENSGATNIGVPVAATNPESGVPHNEKLTYWLSEGDAPGPDILTSLGIPTGATITPTTADTVGVLFSIDPATGQLMTKTSLNSEPTPYYAVTVNVADSSSTTDAVATDAITVIIRVLQTNDAPVISGAATIEHVEGETALDTDLSNAAVNVAAYDATDEDPTDTTLEFSLAAGADEALFELRDATDADNDATPISPAGATRQVLEFKEKPDFENPMDANTDNVYQVTVKVFDGEATTEKDVTVKVTNKQEDGKVAVRPLQARIGVELTATLTDSDIVAYGPTWQWERSAPPCADHANVAEDAWENIPGAKVAAFTPRDIDLNYCLRAVATYNDGYHEETAPSNVDPSSPGDIGLYTVADTRFDKTADQSLSSVQYPTEPNIRPKFGNPSTKRFVLENTAANNPVGKPVTARDGNGPEDALTYTLSGATDAFSIHPTTGQLMTKMKFNHESEDKYTVTVTAKDTHDATDSTRVDIYVVDVDEMPVGVQAQDGTTIEYTENSTDAVVTLSVSDPEGATPITWSLPAGDPDGTGDEGGPLTEADAQDNGDFKVSQSGVLEFNSPPDYDAAGDADANNVYNVVVQATDGDAGNNAVAGGIATGVNMVDDDDTRSWFKVIVNVGDINEDGSINLRPTGHAGATLLQPQIEVGITAHTLMDEDGDSAGVTNPTYQWQRSSSMNGPWENIALPTGTDADGWTAYTPQQVERGERDLGKYLRVMASYTEAGADGRGGQPAIATSKYPTIQVVGVSDTPSFTEGDDTPDGGATTRAVRENSGATNIGVPVAATNPESIAPHNEKLTYWLSEGDAPGPDILTSLGIPTGATITPTTADTVGVLFSIDPATGQLMTKTSLNSEPTPYYAVTVNVADSSVNTTTDAITVIIRVLQTNDAPVISGAATIEHVEGETALDTDLSNAAVNVAAYDATDEDPTDTTLEFSLAAGADEALFELRDATDADNDATPISPAGATRQVLEFKEKPDFENPMDANTDNVYQVTVKVFDGEATTEKDVTVKVTNKQEDGKVAVRPLQARIGVELTATLTDSDIVAYGPTWQWERSAPPCADHANVAEDAWENIPGAKVAAFTPRDIDLNYCLRAVATYNDGYHEETAPSNVDPSSPGDIGLYTVADTRFDKTADQSLSSVQYPTEPNIRPKFGNPSTKRFVLENTAANNPVGKPVTARDGNGPEDALTYTLSGATDAFSIHPTTGQLMTKMKFNHESEDKYTVTVTAKDTHDATDSTRVDIYVVDVDEMPPISKGGLAISGTSSVNYMENGTDAAATYTVSSLTADNAKWTLMGDDARDFRLEPTTGKSSMLKFRNSPDYENPMDSGSDNTYNVVVQATDGTYTVMKNVMVVVTNEVELGTQSGPISSSHMENSTDAVATYTVWGTMADDARWTLEDDADFDHFTLDGTTGMSTMLKFRSPPDYEMPRGKAMSGTNTNTYMVTVKAEAGGETAMVQVTIKVTNMDELGTLSGPGSRSHMENSTDAVATYTLTGGDGSTISWSLDGADSSHFMFDVTGMDRMLKFVSAPDYEMPRGQAMSGTNTNTYMVTVKVSAGGEMEMLEVTVTVTNVDELGTLAGDASLTYAEGDTDAKGTYTLTGTAADTAVWSLDGADASHFMLDGSGTSRMLKFGSAPDYEMPRGQAMSGTNTNTYMVTVKVSASGEMEMLEVTVTVTNVDELGTLAGDASLTYAEGDTDAKGTYTLTGTAADTADWSLDGADASHFMLDGSGTSRMLKFGSAPDYEMPRGQAMSGTNTNTYMVTVMASAGGEMEMVEVTIMVTNVDELGTLSGSTSASIMEGATDTLGTYTLTAIEDGPTVTWSLDETGTSDFMLEGTGMSRMLKFSSAPDYETPMGGADNDSNTYMVTVKAEAGGEMEMVEVTVTVTNVDELGTLSGSTSASIMEGATDTLGTYTLTAIEDGPTVTWSLDETGTSDFMLEGTGMSRMLKFSSAPDYETPMGGADNDSNTYMVTVMAEAGGEMAMQEVTIMVTDVDELGTLSGSDTASINEGDTDLGTYTLTAIEDGPTVTWSLDETGTSDFMLEGTGMSRMLKFSSAPDYETPMGGADNDSNTYMVTVMAEAGGEMAMQEVTIMVTNVNEAGTVTLDPARPSVGSEVTASLTDLDGDVSGTTWQWASADAMDVDFTNIDGADSASYTPVEDDAGMYLQATASYTDGHGTGKMATSEAVMVSADIVGGYDTNGTSGIQIDELFDAIDAYFAGGLTIAELFEVIDAYFASNG